MKHRAEIALTPTLSQGERGNGLRGAACALAFILASVLATPVAYADQTVTLAQRQFTAASPVAPFQKFFVDARKLAASTTPAWASADGDLAAWGPALIFASLERGLSTETVTDLAAPLEAEGVVPVLMFRTLGLYAAKSRVPFADTPTLKQAVSRNLATLARATRNLDRGLDTPACAGWGSVGTAAWAAYLELLYRDYWDLGDPGATSWPGDGIAAVEQLLAHGRLPDGKGFRRDARDEQLALWPNALAIYALVQAYENEELVRYESAAIDAAAVLEALRAADGAYFATAARTEKEPRANAYLAGALLLLFKDTGDVQYRERALGILRWLTSGPAAATQDAALATQVAYVTLLADSLASQPFENLLGRRPMRTTAELGVPSSQAVVALASKLRPPDFRYREMFDAVLHTLVERVPHVTGDFAYDYGDAPGYAAEVLLAGGDVGIAPQIVERQERIAAWPRPRDFDEISFGTGALLAALERVPGGDGPARDALQRYLLLTGALAFLDRDYFDWLDRLTNGGGFEYGPTVIGAQVAATHLHYAERFHDESIAAVIRPVAVGRALIAGADAKAWDAGRHVYRARPGSDDVVLLPNAMMIIDLVKAHLLSAEPAYLARAEEVASGLDVLWDDARGAYAASSAQMGDQLYESLSTNSYAALALLRLSAATHKDTYHVRALRVFDFIRRDLYADGVIYHHLYRGRRSAGDIWCTGCNWRVLSELVELTGDSR